MLEETEAYIDWQGCRFKSSPTCAVFEISVSPRSRPDNEQS